MALDGQADAVVGTSDDDEAVGWASDAEWGELVPTTRSRKKWNLFHAAPRRVMFQPIPSRSVTPSPLLPLRTASVPTATPLPATTSVLPPPAVTTSIPSPPRRHLRARKPAQIHPYTIEALQYRRELYANDWEDAVVSQREWRRRPMHEDVPSSSLPDASSRPRSRPRSRLRSRSRSPSLTIDHATSSASEADSSDDSTDYERRFRVLKHMMPAHMARACIDDLRAMRHGHAYDESASSSDADDVPRPAVPAPTGALQPGESRRRLRARSTSASMPLWSDASSDESSEPTPTRSPSPQWQDGDVRTWMRQRSPSPVREADAIDRMLARTHAERPPTWRRRRHQRQGQNGFGEGAAVFPTAKRSRRTHAMPSTRRTSRVAVPAWIQGQDDTAPSASAPTTTSKARATSRSSVTVVPGVASGHVVQGVPTQRGDLSSHTRLPYIPASHGWINVARDVRVARPPTDMPPHGWPTKPQPVRRSSPARPMAPSTVPSPDNASALPTAWQATPSAWHADLQQFLRWDTVRQIPCDFGVQPPPVGLAFAPSTDLGRGRLHTLLQCATASTTYDVPQCHAHGMAWHASMSQEDVAHALLSVTDRLDESVATTDLLHFLGVWFTWQATHTPTTDAVHVEGAWEAEAACAMLCTWLQDALDRCTSSSPRLSLQLLWCRVQVLFRMHCVMPDRAVSVLEAAHPLVVRLLLHGLASVWDTMPSEGTWDNAYAVLWISLVHVLNAVDALAFWDVWEAACDEWHRTTSTATPLLVTCERTWFALLSVCALSHFHAATGLAGHTPHLAAHWPLVQRLMARLQLRYDEHVEHAVPRALVARRDAYIYTLLRRCWLLHERWQWSFQHAEPLLRHVFDIFDAHRLADLPSETDHDFAPFLRRFDTSALYDAPCPSAYQLFLQLLAQTSRTWQAQPDASRRLARLFSRMTPVRVMPFTKAQPPLSTERAMLFNHYSLVMLFLLFEPASAKQRLRQIRSFLPFASADRASQIACIRAVVYAGTLFRQHGQDLAPIEAWLVDVLQALHAEGLEHASLATTGMEARRTQQMRKEATRMMTVVLRSIQHLIRHASLQPEAPVPYPPISLLHTAWTRDVFASDLSPDVQMEALRIVQVFLEVRQQSLSRPTQASQGTVDSTDDDDDDAWMRDPALASLLGEDWQPPPDEALAAHVDANISPMLFRLLTQWTSTRSATASDTALEALVAQAEAQDRLGLLVDVWAACGAVLVSQSRRAWSAYLTLGRESWKRLSDPIRKRDVAVRLAVRIAEYDHAAVRNEPMELILVWFHTILAYHTTMQATLTSLLQAAQVPWFATLDVPSSHDAFVSQRRTLVADVLDAMRPSEAVQVHMAIQCVSALLSAMRACVEVVSDPTYWAWCKEILAMIPTMDEQILRGVRTELHSTSTLLAQRRTTALTTTTT